MSQQGPALEKCGCEGCSADDGDGCKILKGGCLLVTSVAGQAASKKKVVKITPKYKANKAHNKQKIILYGKAKDGTVVWKFSSPYVPLTELSCNDYFVNKNLLYLFSDKLYVINKSTGKVKWTDNYAPGSPSVAFGKNGDIYYTGAYANGIRCFSAKGKLKFESEFVGPYHWPYKIKIVSKKVRVYIEKIDVGGEYYLIYNKKGKYLGVRKNK